MDFWQGSNDAQFGDAGNYYGSRGASDFVPSPDWVDYLSNIPLVQNTEVRAKLAFCVIRS